MFRDAKRGFTLVELSIVLVIIGLLIGGILVAESMISAANITATVKQIGQFDAGVANFKTKYRYLPGDAPAFGGNGDGVLEGLNYTDMRFFSCETANFWWSWDPQQFPGEYGGCSTPGTAANTGGASKNVPASKIGKPNSFFMAATYTLDGSTIDMTSPENFYILLNSAVVANIGLGGYSTVATSRLNSAVKPSDLLALDSKMDDGIGTTGNVISGSIANSGNGTGGAILSPLSTCSDSSTGVYAVQNDTYECTPLIRIGAQTGDPD